MIDDAEAARELVSRWFAPWASEYGFTILEMIDLGRVWRVLVEVGPSQRTIIDGVASPPYGSPGRWAVRVDKATGEVVNERAAPLKIGPSAQDGFRALMTNTVAPRLRDLGFVRSGRVFTWPHPDYLAGMSIQTSRTSEYCVQTFTANLTVISRAVWAARPHAGDPGERFHPDYLYGGSWHHRLGHLSRHRRDHWWEVWAGFSTVDTAADFLDAVTNHALPAMLEHIATSPEHDAGSSR